MKTIHGLWFCEQNKRASLHVPMHEGPTCGHRNKRTNSPCTLAAGHEGRHLNAWRYLCPGHVREVWD